MATAAHQALGALLTATPPAPDPLMDPAEVLELATTLFSNREPHLEALRAELGANPNMFMGDAAATEVLAELNNRDADWSAALIRARDELRRRVTAVHRMKSNRKDATHGR